MDPENNIATLAAEFAKATSEVKKIGEEVTRQYANGEKVSTEIKQKADEALTKQGELAQSLAEMKQRQNDLEQSVVKAIKGIGQRGDDVNELRTKLTELCADPALVRAANGDNSGMRGKTYGIEMNRKALTNSGVTGAALSYPGDMVLPRPLQPLLRRLTIRDLIAPGRTSKPNIWYIRESGYTNNAAPVSEGSLKPKNDITFDLVNGHVSTIAVLQDISLQMLDDVDFIESYITERMTYGLKLVEEGQLLNGSGTGQNLNGIYTQATQYAQPAGSVVQNEQDIDKLRLAMLQVELAFANATGIVLHPTSWANIELLKNSQNNYLIANPQGTTTGVIWGRDVVSTQAMSAGTFLVGDFRMYSQIFDRQDINVAISFENKDNFERNMATLRVEERLALAVYRPQAFVKGVLESASH